MFVQLVSPLQQRNGPAERFTMTVILFPALFMFLLRAILSFEFQKLRPSHTSSLPLPSIDNTNTSLTPSLDGTRPNLEPSADGASPNLRPSLDGTRPNLEPSVDGTRPNLKPSEDGTRPNLEPSVDGTSPNLKPSIDGTSPNLKPSVDGTSPNLKPSVGGTSPDLKPSVDGTSPNLKPSTQGSLWCALRPATSDKLLLKATFRTWADPARWSQVAFTLHTSGASRILGVTAIVTPSGFAEATLPALEPANGLESAKGLFVSARTLLRGKSEGDRKAWSGATKDPVPCNVSPSPDVEPAEVTQPPTKIATNAGPATHFLEVYRGTEAPEPDYLDEHNAADLIGSGRMMFKGAQWTRYCVEVLNVSLNDISATEESSDIHGSPYSNFLSCNRGRCVCIVFGDRLIGRFPRDKHRAALCDGRNWPDSQRYIGRLPVKYPSVVPKGPAATRLKEYPPWDNDLTGYWYHFPTRSKCGPKQSVGDGCTWRREAAYSEASKLLATNTTRIPWQDQVIFPTSTLLSSVASLKEAFDADPLKLPACR